MINNTDNLTAEVDGINFECKNKVKYCGKKYVKIKWKKHLKIEYKELKNTLQKTLLEINY